MLADIFLCFYTCSVIYNKSLDLITELKETVGFVPHTIVLRKHVRRVIEYASKEAYLLDIT